MGIEAVVDKLLESQAVPLTGAMHRLTSTHFLWVPALGQQIERHQRYTGRNWIVQHPGGNWAQLSPRQKGWQRPVFLSEPSLLRATEPAGRCHIWDSYQPGSHCSPHPGDSLRPCPTNSQGHPSCFQWLFHMNGLSWLMLQIFLNSLKLVVASGFSEPRPLIKLLQAWD